MSGVLEVASGVTTPIGITAFAIGVMLLAFREIVRKNLLPSLTKSMSGDIIRLLIDRLFWLALVALLIGGATLLAPKVISATPTQELRERRIKAQIPQGQPAYDFGESGIKVKFNESRGAEAAYTLVLPDGSLVRNIALEGHRYDFTDKGVTFSFRVNAISSNWLDLTLVKNATPQ